MILAHERANIYKEILDSIHSVVFFGVPHRGADQAYWAEFAATVVKVSQLGFGTNTNFVRDLKRNSSAFATIAQQFIERGAQLRQIRTFYETEKLLGQLVWS
jgi:hypothetical protein